MWRGVFVGERPLSIITRKRRGGDISHSVLKEQEDPPRASSRGNEELVIRFGKHVADFGKDQLAYSYATLDLPIPKLLVRLLLINARTRRSSHGVL